MEGVVTYFGVWSLIPPLIVLAFALWTKKTFEALLLGALVAFSMLYKGNFLNYAIDATYDIICDADTEWVFLSCGLFGALIALLEKAKSTTAFTKLVSKKLKNGKQALLASTILGIIIFIDDYLSAMAIGSSMKKVTDKKAVPREALGVVTQATAGPVCLLFPITSWAVFWAGIYAAQKEWSSLGSGMEIFTKTIVFNFFSFAIVIVAVLFSLGIIPPIGAMKKAYERVKETGRVYSEVSDKYNEESDENDEEDSEKIDIKGLINFFVPFAVLIIVSIVSGDILVGVIWSIISVLVLYLPTKTISFEDYTQCFIKGFASMLPLLMIVYAALLFQRAANEAGMSVFVVNSVVGIMSPKLLPVITFIILSLISFIVGSNWGAPAACVPIIAPLSVALGANPLLTIGAISAASAFGATGAFYCDDTVLTSSSIKIDNMEHVLSQLPYVVIAFVASVLLYTVLGFIM